MRILLLVNLLILAAAPAMGMKLDLDNPNGIAAMFPSSEGRDEDITFIVATDGSGYYGEVQEYGTWFTFNPSPVPLEEVVDWTPWILYTVDGRWFARGDATGVWEEMGVDMEMPTPPCFQPVANETTPLGGVKGLYR